MIALYTAVGKYVHRTDGRGNHHPVVIANGQEHVVDIREMIVWTLLCWRILNPDEVISMYEKRLAEFGLSSDIKVGVILERLMHRDIIARGIGDTGEDALYDLFSSLFIIPVTGSIFARLFLFLKLTLRDGHSINTAKVVLRRDALSENERRVTNIARQAQLSTSEIIRCVELGVFDVSSDEKILDSLYGDDDTTFDNLLFSAKYYENRRPVLTAVSNLYLKKQILLECKGCKL